VDVRTSTAARTSSRKTWRREVKFLAPPTTARAVSTAGGRRCATCCGGSAADASDTGGLALRSPVEHVVAGTTPTSRLLPSEVQAGADPSPCSEGRPADRSPVVCHVDHEAAGQRECAERQPGPYA
jgi:hypothetical protein